MASCSLRFASETLDRKTLLTLDQGEALEVFKVLGDTFWPGGLTIVGPAQPHVPRTLGAGTGTVNGKISVISDQ